MTVDMNDMTMEIQSILKETGSAVDTALTDTLKVLAKDTADDLKRTSPKQKTRNGGKYAKGWTYKEVSKGNFVVYNKQYQLTHLIEKGHKTRLKTGKYGKVAFTKSNPHIANAERKMKERVEPEFEKNISVQLKKV